jgi:hypothetical protein
MHKVWFGRLWCMAGRWQALTLAESPLERPRIVAKAWMRQIYAPYWYGSGVALTLGPYSLRFGTCRPGMDVATAEDDFDWGEFDAGFDQHLDASVFEGLDETLDVVFDVVEPELVTAFIDTRTNALTAVVHRDGEVEWVAS